MYISSTSTEQSYKTLKGLDFDGDFKITGKEVQFTEALNKLKENPSPENLKKALDIMGKITNDKNKLTEIKKMILLTLISAKCSEPPTVDEFNNILKLFPEKSRSSWADTMLSLSSEVRPETPSKVINGEIQINPESPLFDVMEYNKKEGKLELFKKNNGDPYQIPSFKEKFEQLKKERLDLGKDLLDGDTTIKGVDQEITGKLLGKKKDGVTLNTYKEGDFDPKSFRTFDFKIQKHTVKNEDQEIIIEKNASSKNDSADYVNPQTNTGSKYSIPEFREQMMKDYPEFKKFAEENKIFNEKGELDNSKLDLVKKFVDGIPDTGKKMTFVSNFMSAYFVHSGEGASQKGVDEDNFLNILSSPQMLRADDGRTIIDCQYFSAVSQKLLGVSKGKNDQGLESRDITISCRPLKPVNAKDDYTLHQVSIIKDTNTGKYYIQSNDKIEEITTEQLKAAGYDEKKSKGKPPTDKQFIAAASYNPRKGDKGLLGKQLGGRQEFFNINVADDPLSNQILKGATRVATVSNNGAKCKYGNQFFFMTFDGQGILEKNKGVTFSDGTKGDVTITDVGKGKTFIGKTKDQTGAEIDVIVSYDSNNKPVFTKVTK